LVPINGKRLDAALEDRGIKRREAARRLEEQGIDVKSQTLDNIAAGKQVKCRATLRAALARLVNRSEQWLSTGSSGAPTWSADSVLHVYEHVPRAGLARDRIRWMLTQAWRRDLERGVAPAPSYKGTVDDQSQEAFRQYIELAVDRLLSVWWWRQLLLKDGGDWRVSPEDAEQFATGLANALEALLGPWFKDRSALSFGAFGQLLTTITTAQPAPVRSGEVRSYARSYAAAHRKQEEKVESQLRMIASVERGILKCFRLQRPRKR
jgi:hypothetical protein